MSLKAVFFDLDGTLLDTAPDFVITLQQLAHEYKRPVPDEKNIRQTVSNGARALTTLLFDLQEGEAGFEERRQRLLDIYYQHMGQHSKLFDGMDKLIQLIAQHHLDWGIITNKPVRFAKPIVDALTLAKAPDILLCPDHVQRTKPDAEPIIKACEQLGHKTQEVIYIGDHQRDIQCGLNAGCETIAVTFGYIRTGENIDDWSATYVVDHSDEIWPILTTKT